MYIYMYMYTFIFFVYKFIKMQLHASYFTYMHIRKSYS